MTLGPTRSHTQSNDTKGNLVRASFGRSILLPKNQVITQVGPCGRDKGIFFTHRRALRDQCRAHSFWLVSRTSLLRLASGLMLDEIMIMNDTKIDCSRSNLDTPRANERLTVSYRSAAAQPDLTLPKGKQNTSYVRLSPTGAGGWFATRFPGSFDPRIDCSGDE